MRMTLVLVLVAAAIAPLPALSQASPPHVVLAAVPQAESPPSDGDEKNLTPQQRMERRYPQPVRVGALIGLPVLDWQDSTIGFIRQVVRTSDGRVLLIVPYGRWFGWLSYGGASGFGRRPVAVPIESVAILARQVAALDMSREEFDAAPAFMAADAVALNEADTIRIAITRR